MNRNAEEIPAKTGWLDKPGNFKLVLRLFFTSLALLLAVDFFIHKDHASFPWEGAPDFFAAYGFISCVVLVLVAKVLRMIVRRREGYYDH